jgi:nonsense-mediated mRNA decay protein 3
MAGRRRLFCYLCGRTTDKLIDGKCKQCLLKGVEVLKFPDKVTARVCRECLRYLSRGRWISSKGGARRSIEMAVRSSLEEGLPEMKIIETEFSYGEPMLISHKKCILPYEIKVTCLYKGLEHSEARKGRARVSLVLCEDCARKHGGYYEAVLQLRGHDGLEGEVTKELDTIIRSMKNSVTQLKRVKKGVDVYMNSLAVARKAAKALRDRFGGEIRESSKLVGMKKGTAFHRVSISLKVSKFRKGDVLLYDGRELEVLEVGRSRVKVHDIAKRKTLHLPLKTLLRLSIFRKE